MQASLVGHTNAGSTKSVERKKANQLRGWIPKLTGTAAAVWLALAAWVTASAQDPSPLHATLPPAAPGVREAQPDNSPLPEGGASFPHTVREDPDSDPICDRPGCVSCSLPRSPAFAEISPNPPEQKPSEKKRPISYGVEIALSSGHAYREIGI